MGYTAERDAITRTPQAILTLAVTRCCNWYAQQFRQNIGNTEDFSHVTAWTPVNCTITVNQAVAPDGSISADKLAFAAADDYIRTATTELAAANKAFTASCFVRAVSGTGTITIRIEDFTNSEGTEVQWSIGTAGPYSGGFYRITVHRLFSGGAAGNVRMRIIRRTGDLAEIYAWGAQETENPNDVDAVFLWPYRKRTTGQVSTVSTMASRCQATDAGDGSRCSYSAPTCQDPENFNAGNDWELTLPFRGLREYKFCLKQAPLPIKGAIIRPMLASFDEAPQEIDGLRAAKSSESHGGFVTRNESVTYRLEDDADPGNFDLDKAGEGALTNTARGSGTFWRRWLAIHRNFDNPRGYAKLATGFLFPGVVEADFKTRLSGPIVEVKINPGGIASVEARDGLHLTKRKIPSSISADNLLVGAIDASVTSISVDDPTEISDPAPNADVAETFDAGGARTGGPDWIVTIQIGTEKMNVTAKTIGGNPITVQRGRWGTAATTHADNSAFTEIREFGTEQLAPSNPVLGINPIDWKHALYREAGVPWAQINTAFNLDQRETWVYSSVDRTLGLQSGVLFRRTLTQPVDIDTLLQEIDRDLIAFQYVDEDRLVRTRVFAFPAPSETPIELTDVSHFVENSVEVEQDNEARLSRVAVGWDLIPGERGDVLGDYSQIALSIDSFSETPGYHGTIRDRIILSQNIRATDTAQGKATADGILARFVNGSRIVHGSLEAKDDDNVTLGTFVYVTTAQLQNVDGTTDTRRLMLCVHKERDATAGRMRVRFLDCSILTRPIFFAEDTAASSYDSATEQERRWWYIGNSANRVGTANDDGYYITR